VREGNPPSWFPRIECAASASSPRLLVAQLLRRGGGSSGLWWEMCRGLGEGHVIVLGEGAFFAALSHYCILQSAWEDDGI
jgi:hypothetical protein